MCNAMYFPFFQVSKEMKSSQLAEMPPHQDGFQAIAKAEMEMGEERGVFTHFLLYDIT